MHNSVAGWLYIIIKETLYGVDIIIDIHVDDKVNSFGPFGILQTILLGKYLFLQAIST